MPPSDDDRAGNRLDPRYAAMIRTLTEDAERDEEVIGLLLTGSLARGDALPGTDIDLRSILVDGAARPSTSAPRDGLLVEEGYADEPTACEALVSEPMNVYAYLDGRILYDPRESLARLTKLARERFEAYRMPATDKERIAFLMACTRDKIEVGLRAGDLLRAAYAASTSSWGIIEALWAANDLPLPPNSSVRPHLTDLADRAGPADIAERFTRLFLGTPEQRAREAVALIAWADPRLR